MQERSETKPATPAPIRFRLVRLIYVTAAFGISLGTFGVWGLLTGTILVGACNLKQIAIALHNYHDAFKRFPPPVIADENGRPVHSWRVLISPFIESSPFYDTYDFNEPWDGQNNSKLAPQLSRVYGCPSHGTNRGTSHTNYVAVVGPKTAWPDDGSRFGTLLDGASLTTLVLEIDSRDIHWMEPRDISYAEAVKLLSSSNVRATGPHRHETFFYTRSVGRNAAFADGSVKLIPRISPDVAGAVVVRDDGALPNHFELVSRDEPRLRIDNCLRLAVFVLIALWPLPWVWNNPHGTTPTILAEPSQAQ